jgi:hypothetical protein
MSKALRGHQRFAEYDYRPAAELGTEMGVAIWRESRHSDSMQELLNPS